MHPGDGPTLQGPGPKGPEIESLTLSGVDRTLGTRTYDTTRLSVEARRGPDPTRTHHTRAHRVRTHTGPLVSPQTSSGSPYPEESRATPAWSPPPTETRVPGTGRTEGMYPGSRSEQSQWGRVDTPTDGRGSGRWDNTHGRTGKRTVGQSLTETRPSRPPEDVVTDHSFAPETPDSNPV